MRCLPTGWVFTPIGEICSLKNGRAFKPTEWTTSGRPIVRIQNLNNPNASFNHYSGDVEDRYRLKGGELLFAWSGTPGTSFGAHVWNGGEAVLNQHIFRVDFDETKIDKRFLRFAINQKLGELIDMAHGGVGLRHVTKRKFESTSVLLPPLVEQKQIADKLGTVLARVNATRARLARVPGLLKRFRQAVLAAATSGALTEEWRLKGDDVAFPWVEAKIGDVGKVQLGRQRAPKFHQGKHMRPYLRVQNVFDGRLDLSDVMEMDFPPEDFEKYQLSPGDILLNEGQSPEYLGRPALYRGELPGACFTNTLIRFQASSRVLPEFALIVFRHHMHSGRYLKEGKITTNIAHLGARRFGEVEFPLPSLGEQLEIVRRVESLFAVADKIEAQYEQARGQLENLTSSLLAKAFRGELVSQGPDDEPAEKLLERVNALAKTAPRARMRPRAMAN
ncbi:restriction endonuclease subunit S [Ralstonia pseudosolanacearum]|uniref:restriction endonuclease subunit S n=1 Tax=Ralstonia pseudosolanacearum TaxID=1310165 RepID=UPI0018A53542|nr:restriction endonuclease subunit S [Ralstonia pseudosolanacearum]BCL90919.1 type I restriction enzyme EcoEI specificity protein [Ralstonia solanacearum]BCN03483.1 type I restriction enzyme EcoEI specificity protein [Ralstonia solanacearum]